MKKWIVKRTGTDGLEDALNDLTEQHYEIFSINSSPVPGYEFHEYVISAYKLVDSGSHPSVRELKKQF